MRKALVLGGGGITGIAWEIGMLSWLQEAGLDLTGADLVVGTSAGSVVGAQATSGMPLAKLYERQLAPPDGEVSAHLSRAGLLGFVSAYLIERDPDRARARIGRAAHRSALRRPNASVAERRAVIAGRLVSHDWPDADLRVAAVDVRTGRRKVFDRDSGVPIVDAVAASCAVPGVWPPVPAGGSVYMDGGVYSTANIDVAAGYDRVVVLAPIAHGIGPLPGPAAQLSDLPGDPKTVLVTPDKEAVAAFGGNVLDPRFRAPAARAGRTQAPDVLRVVGEVWGG
ncbi:patatin-like phospholipase family protein [Nocardiopsis suaedae]|uniref:Patatin-like phospholipase family protein n=1 Tax=Nocardiopsis suaedae TaxID=3018444 RepID=A0ABT4TEQ5_9ACTN|nr:patatin-like phospholipase family protein [Nocardiopsis suaedae]MDA2803184.1 patatin-like phospholipase family protein [Nocardiopsis suaedae]